MEEWSRPGGIRDRLLLCKKIAAEKDPNDTGAVEEVNAVCANVTTEMGSIGVFEEYNVKLYSIGLSFIVG